MSNFTLSQKSQKSRMVEGDRAASRPLCQSPVNVMVIPLINMLTLSIIVAPPAGKTIQYPDRLFEYWLDQEKFLRLSSTWETVNESLT